MELAGKRFLVTGGCGFIGWHVVQQLVKAGARVTIGDVNTAHSQEGYDILSIDITNPASIRRAMEGMDGVFHMAVLPLNPSQTDPRKCFNINVAGTFNVLEAAAEAKVKRVVFSSASSVYGDTNELMGEDHPLNAKTIYGISKIMGENLCRMFWEKCGLPYVALRYMNVYGPGQTGGVIYHTLKNLAEGKPPRINGTGEQSFDFVYVTDIACTNLLAMQSDASDEAFNVGGDAELSLNELVAVINTLVEHPLQPEHVSADVPMMRRVGSSRKATRHLGYVPRYDIVDGLREIIKQDFPQLQKGVQP